MQDGKRPVVMIGSREYIDLPDFGVCKIPARVDTGANTSALWASNTHVRDGKLVFNLFAPKSSLYRREPVVSDKYRSTVVRNSFGVKESRYVVSLRVRLGGKTLRRWFTLADRSNNTYPVLLGRNFLKQAFVVNVAEHFLHHEDGGAKKVLILTRDIEESEQFFEKVRAANKVDVTYTCIPYSSLIFYLDGHRSRVVNARDDIDIAEYDFTYFKNHHDHEPAYAAAEYLRFKGRQFADQEFVMGASHSKLSEYMKLSCHGIPVPPAVCAKTQVLLTSFELIKQTVGVPFVLKAANSDKGRNNYLVKKQKDFEDILRADDKKRMWLAQEFIPNDGFYRVFVFGSDAALTVWRSSVPHKDVLKQHLNKPSGSVNATKVTKSAVPGAVQRLALEAASCMNRQIAGVDLLQDKRNQKWYILEANNDPQIRSGSSVPDKVKTIAGFFDKKLGR